MDQGAETRKGEDQGLGADFTLQSISEAFGVEIERVRHAAADLFGTGRGETVDSRQAQELAEALLTDQPLAEREAALMTLGAYTPRSDDAWGVGDTAPGEESDRLAASTERPADELASADASYAPSTQDAE